MQVSVEAPSKLERRITVIVPSEKLDQAFDQKIVSLAKKAKVKGFRPGNVPVSHIKQMYGDSARQEALSEVIQSSLYEAITQEKLQPVGVPTVEPKSIQPGQPIEYTATFEVMPEIGEVVFKLDSLEKQIAAIQESDVDKVVDRLREQHITWKEVDRTAQDKDQVVVDFRGSIDGKAFTGGEAHEYPIVIGSNTMIPGFESGITGLKKGDKKTITVTFPENYFAKEVAGKAAQFDIDVHKVSEPQFPEINSDLIKKFGVKSGSVDELRGEIKKNLEREVERIVSAKLKGKVFDALIEQNPIEIPNALIEQEAKRIHDEMHPHHAGKEHNHTPAEMATFNDAAKRNVTLGILIGEFVKKHNIKPEQNRVQDHITKLSSAYEKPAEVIQWYAADKRRLAEVEMYILEEQVIEKLLEGVNVSEKSQSYSELITN